MNDLVIKVSKRSRLIDLDHSTLGIVGENLQEKLIFTFQDEFVDGMARLEYELAGEKRYVLMEKVGQSYILPVQNVLLTKEGNIDLQLVITEDNTGTPVFKSEVFTLYCKKSIEAVGEAPSSYELWIETANRILLEASRVNIDGAKTGNETVITITQRDGNKKNFSILDGHDGQDGQDGNGIISIEKTSTSGLVDTYTITFTDGTTTTFEVTNGNGIVSIEKTSTSGLVDTYTITFTDGTTTTYTVTNGESPDLSNYVQKPEFNASQATQDERTSELQSELERYKMLENALPHTENETASDYVTLNNTAKSPMEIETIPQTSQDGEPTPDTPQDIHRTTGENQVKVVGKNLFDKILYQGGINENTGEETSSNYVVRTDFIRVANNENYTLSFEYINVSNYNVLIAEYDSEQSFVKSTRSINRNVSSILSNNRTSYLRISFYSDARPTPATFDNFFDEVQLENNSTATSYLPYEETTYPISLGTKEMFNISNVSDGFVYDEATDKFYINRLNEKIVLNGSESWNTSTNCFYITSVTNYKTSGNIPVSNYFRGVTNVGGAGGIFNIPDDNICAFINQSGSVTPRFYIKALTLGDLTAFKSWLSTHNTIVVYQLATSTLEEVTDTTLISQLRAIKNALSMQGTTHIISTASGSNLPFLIKARAVQTIERT